MQADHWPTAETRRRTVPSPSVSCFPSFVICECLAHLSRARETVSLGSTDPCRPSWVLQLWLPSPLPTHRKKALHHFSPLQPPTEPKSFLVSSCLLLSILWAGEKNGLELVVEGKGILITDSLKGASKNVDKAKQSLRSFLGVRW